MKRQNLLTYAGWLVVTVSFAIGCVLIGAEMLFHQGNPYTALVTYMLIPMAIGGGVGLVALGLVLDWRWKRQHGPDETRRLPVIDLNQLTTRKRILIGLLIGTGFFSVSAIAAYRAFVYTESTSFCGTICHHVMEPEYAAHQASPHARVKCVECHIGPGAGWYVRSKLSGLRQAWNVTLGSYEFPIHTPVANLRPATDTCEHCHWPARFGGSVERVYWHFWYDEASTPSRMHLMMRIGGVNPATGRPEGIHWHSSSADVMRYYARDERRSDIPWIEIERVDGTRVVYRSPDAGLDQPPQDGIRRMDCIDCHNRPAHIFRPPSEVVNIALSEGTLDRSLPYMKRHAVEILSVDHRDRLQARISIAAEVTRRFRAQPDATQAALIDALTGLYEATHFPNQGTSWRTHPDHLGHRVFPGCFRCHDGKHQDDAGNAIRNDCDLCHSIVHQAWREAAYGPVTYRTQPFEHPGGQADLHGKRLCTDCHATDVKYPGHPEEKR